MSAQSVKALADQRVRRQKIFIAVGSVVLLAVLGFELPKVMGHKNAVSAAPAITAATPGVGTPAVPVVPAGTLPNTDRVAVVRDTNQLISFGLFKSKDPFVQQISDSPAPSTSAAPKPPPAPAAKPTPIPAPPLVPPGLVPPAGAAPPAAPPAAPGATTTAPTTTTPTPTPAAAVPTDALIATNGVCERIAPNGTFPSDENIFRLVSIARSGKSVEIGIVGGSFDSGKPTATLKLGDKLTLVNTADGTRYVIALKASCAVVAPSGSSTPSPSTTTTPVAPPASPPATTTTTTTTTTTPIVTDSLDTTTPNPFG
jgi:hypothetical protein